MAKRRFVYFLSLVGCVAFYLFYRQWLAGLVLTALLALPVFSLAVSLPAMATTRMDMPEVRAVQRGEEAKVKLTVTSSLPEPPCRGALEIRNTMTGEIWDEDDACRLPTDHCGMLEIRARRCRVYDYLGLWRLPRRRIPAGKVLVRPVPVPLEVPPDLSRYTARVWRPKRGGGFGENHELRLYRPGDNLQQIHWKLTAKTGKLILRETVEPERGLMLLKLDLTGEPEDLDRKLGKLLWISGYLLDRELRHEIRALTGKGLLCSAVGSREDLSRAVDALLAAPKAEQGSIAQREMAAVWEYYIGGGEDEA